MLNSGCSSWITMVLDSMQALIRAEIRDSCGFACTAELRIQRAVLPAPEALRLIDRLILVGAYTRFVPANEIPKIITDEIAHWSKLVRDAKIPLQD